MTDAYTQGLDIYLVGGAVRDQLMGEDYFDRDWVVVGTTPEVMIERGFMPIGKDFPVFLHPETKEEYALARTERKTGPGYKGFDCFFDESVTLEEDLMRRDLTINAIAMHPDGQLIDPYQGQQALEGKILKHVSPAFKEDPLRVLRLARFYARYKHLGFNIDPETLALCTAMVEAGELAHLKAERVWQEVESTLYTETPTAFFEILSECGAFKALWPKLHEPYLMHQEAMQQCLVRATEIAPTNRAVNLASFLVALYPLASQSNIIDIIRKTFKCPNHYITLIQRTLPFHESYHNALSFSAEDLLTFYESVDAIRQPLTFDECLQVALCHTSFNQVADYPPCAYLWDKLQKIRIIPAQPFLDQGLKGIEIKQAIRNKRLTILREIT